MNFKKISILLLVLTFSHRFVLSQVASISPSPGNVVWCPNEYKVYSASVTNRTGCTYTWSSADGTFYNSVNTGASVTFKWNDISTLGKLKVTITCGGETFVKEESYVIRSLKNVIPQNISSLATPLPLCSTSSFDVFINEVIVPNTGPFTNINPYYAEGYEWSVPAGWSKLVSGNRVTITPNNGCSIGNVKVRGYISSCGTSDPATWFYSEWSDELTLRTDPTFTTTSNNLTSYTLLCGNTNSVTFSVPAISCATGYSWEFPSGWRTTGGYPSPVTVSGSQNNTITLIPPSTNSNSITNLVPIVGSGVRATVNLSCKSYLASPVGISFSDVALSTPNFSGISVNDVCSASSGSVSLSNVSGADSYSWWITTPGTMYINGGAYTSSNPLITTSSSVTVSVPTVTTGYNNTIVVKANRANGCTGSQQRTKDIWAGKPLSIGGSLSGPSSAVRGNYVTYTINSPTSPNGGSFDWSLPLGTVCTVGSSTCTSITSGGDGSNTMTVRFGNNTSSGNIQIRKQNNCGAGGALLKYVTITGSIDEGGGGGCNPCPIIEVYPNPTNSTHLTVAFTTETQIELEENNSTALISVYTLAGQVVHKEEYDVRKNQRFELPILDLPEGNYVLKVNFNDREEIHHLKLKQ